MIYVCMRNACVVEKDVSVCFFFYQVWEPHQNSVRCALAVASKAPKSFTYGNLKLLTKQHFISLKRSTVSIKHANTTRTRIHKTYMHIYTSTHLHSQGHTYNALMMCKQTQNCTTPLAAVPSPPAPLKYISNRKSLPAGNFELTAVCQASSSVQSEGDTRTAWSGCASKKKPRDMSAYYFIRRMCVNM